MEQVVLLDASGQAIGAEDKATVHHRNTPLHLAFSCYVFNDRGEFLLTRRALHKWTFPGVWTNTCCGHPGPGEDLAAAVRRRLRVELGLAPADLRLVLPEFSYRASMDGIEENELCPVYMCTLDGDPRPNPDEVEAWEWWSWDRFLDEANDPAGVLSPWARLQAPLLAERGGPLRA